MKSDYFEVFGLPRKLQVDLDALQRRFYDLSRRHHPDFHQGDDAGAQVQTLEASALVNRAYRALRTGGTLPAAMNAANEEAVQAFIEERISFADIPEIIKSVMDEHRTSDVKDLDTVVGVDRSARAAAQLAIAQLSRESRVTGVA